MSKNVEKKTGVTATVIIHWPYGKKGGVNPQIVDGFSTEIKLPFNGEK